MGANAHGGDGEDSQREEFLRLEALELTRQPALVNVEDGVGNTRLLDAAFMGDLARVKMLLAKGADPDFLSARGWTPLISTMIKTTRGGISEAGRRAAAPLLIAAAKNLDRHAHGNDTALHHAVQLGDTELVALLLNRSAGVDVRGEREETPIFRLISLSDAKLMVMVPLLLARSPRLTMQNVDGETPLYMSVDHGRAALTQTLLDRGADPNVADRHGRTPLYAATRHKDEATVRQLLRAGAKVTLAANDGFTPLHLAAYEGEVTLVKTLLADGSAIELAVHGGDTPLALAVKHNTVDVCLALLAAGADPNTSPQDGRPTLHVAVSRQLKTLVDALLKRGARLDGLDREGSSALQQATGADRAAFLRLLLDAGASVNLPNRHGDTVLHAAVNDGDYEAVKLLLARGADPNAHRSYDGGATPVDIARRLKDKLMLDLLESSSRRP